MARKRRLTVFLDEEVVNNLERQAADRYVELPVYVRTIIMEYQERQAPVVKQ